MTDYVMQKPERIFVETHAPGHVQAGHNFFAGFVSPFHPFPAGRHAVRPVRLFHPFRPVFRPVSAEFSAHFACCFARCFARIERVADLEADWQTGGSAWGKVIGLRKAVVE
ncbi:MAG: hypothetical protein WD533_01750 [Dehalococcoidia bacterium]